jgi:hypothetical protein
VLFNSSLSFWLGLPLFMSFVGLVAFSSSRRRS